MSIQTDTKARKKRSAPGAKAAPAASGPGPDVFPPVLLDRMTGRLGTDAEMRERGLKYQAALGMALHEAILNATGLEIDVRAAAIRTGRRRELWGELIDDAAFCTATLRGWSSELSYFCGTPIVIAVVECLLGGADPAAIEAESRPLSEIELDMSLVLFEQLGDVLKASVSDDAKMRSMVAKPAMEIPVPEDDPYDDFHAAAISFNLEFGPVIAPLTFLAPQSVLLKTVPVKRAGLKADELKAQADWKERLSKRVVASSVRLEARIALDQMSLGQIGRLQPGDVLPFSEEKGMTVVLGGNGRDIYNCALGRSGQRYMVRIEGAAGVDEDWREAFG